MNECALTAVWCFTMSMTVLDPTGYRAMQDSVEFNSEQRCREYEDYYGHLAGQPMFGYKQKGGRAAMHQFAIVITAVECIHMGRLP